MQRIGMVGAGGMGTNHASCYARMPDAKVVAVMDIRPEAARKLAEAHGAEAYTDLGEMLATAELDAVDVCTPTPWHSECVVAAAKAGKHVVSEKPMARTIEQCRQAIAAVEEAGVRYMVAHVLRYFPEFRRAKELIEAGAVGKPAIVRTSRGGSYPRAWEDWFAKVEWSGGVILDLIIHDFDWLIWCFGDADRVFAKSIMFDGHDHLDYALVTIRFKSGVIAHVEGSWANPRGFMVKVEVAGDGGLLELDETMGAPLVVARSAAEAAHVGVPVPESPTHLSPYFLELEHFIQCLESGTEPEITPREAMRAVEVAVAAIESVRTGRPIELSNE